MTFTAYDQMGRLLTRDDGTDVTTYCWDQFDLVHEATGESVTEYLVSSGVIRSFLRDGDLYTLNHDCLSSVRTVTDSEGAVAAQIVFDAWGQTLSGSVDLVPGNLPVLFIGGLGVRKDLLTGLYYMRQRWYDPTLQRFISRDPIDIRGGANLYAYALNNPTSNVDPSGLDITVWYMKQGFSSPIPGRVDSVPTVFWKKKTIREGLDDFAYDFIRDHDVTDIEFHGHGSPLDATTQVFSQSNLPSLPGLHLRNGNIKWDLGGRSVDLIKLLKSKKKLKSVTYKGCFTAGTLTDPARAAEDIKYAKANSLDYPHYWKSGSQGSIAQVTAKQLPGVSVTGWKGFYYYQEDPFSNFITNMYNTPATFKAKK